LKKNLQMSTRAEPTLPASSAQRTVAYGDATLPEQKNTRQMSRRAEYAAQMSRRAESIYPPPSAQRTVACGDAALPQQEEGTRQMSRRTEYAAMYLRRIGVLAVARVACYHLSAGTKWCGYETMPR
jgi:hypothetical protein